LAADFSDPVPESEGPRICETVRGHSILISSLQILSLMVVLSDEYVIVSDPDVCGGKPVARGTRVPVQYILELSTKGYDVEKIHGEYPTVSRDLIARVLKLLSESKIIKVAH